MDKLQIVLRRSIITTEPCVDCKGNSIICYATEDTDPQVWIVKCLDCGIIGINSDNQEMKTILVLFMNILDKINALNYTVDTSELEYFHEVMKAMKK